MRKLFLLVALVAGCGGESFSQEAPETEATSTPALAAPAPIVGCWHDVAPAGTYDLTFGADGTCSYAGVKFNGNPIGYTCTWTDGAAGLTISTPTWSLLETYAIQGDTLTITQGASSSTWTREACK